MMSRLLLVIAAVVASTPASAQTRIINLQAADAIGPAILSKPADRIAARVGKNRIVVWSLPDGKPLQELTFPHTPIAILFAEADQIIVALADGGIEVRAITSGNAIRRMDAGARQPVLALSPDGRLLASSGAEQIRVWDASGTLLRTFGHEFGTIASLAFSPDGTLLASAGYDANVHLWDVSTGQRKTSLPDQLVATFSVTFTADGKHLIIGGANGAIEIIDVQTASTVRRFRPEKYAVSELSVSPDGRSIAAGYFDVNSVALPAPVAVWELASGRVVQRVVPGAPALAAAFTTDGRLLYATAKGQDLHVWGLSGSTMDKAGPVKRK